MEDIDVWTYDNTLPLDGWPHEAPPQEPRRHKARTKADPRTYELDGVPQLSDDILQEVSHRTMPRGMAARLKTQLRKATEEIRRRRLDASPAYCDSEGDDE